jgi:hypothetical protein
MSNVTDYLFIIQKLIWLSKSQLDQNPIVIHPIIILKATSTSEDKKMMQRCTTKNAAIRRVSTVAVIVATRPTSHVS